MSPSCLLQMSLLQVSSALSSVSIRLGRSRVDSGWAPLVVPGRIAFHLKQFVCSSSILGKGVLRCLGRLGGSEFQEALVTMRVEKPGVYRPAHQAIALASESRLPAVLRSHSEHGKT